MSTSGWLGLVSNGKLWYGPLGLALTTFGVIAALTIGGISGVVQDADGGFTNNAEPNGVGPFGVPFRDFCYQGEPPSVGLVGRLAPGYTVGSFEVVGYRAAQAIDGAESDLVVLERATDPFPFYDDRPDAPEELQGHPALSSVGFVLAQSEDPPLRSCHHRLSDKSAASEIAARATAWMVANGVLTQDQIDAGGTTFQLAEDPTIPAHLFFTVLLATPGGGIPGGAEAASLTSYVATIDKASGAVLAHW